MLKSCLSLKGGQTVAFGMKRSHVNLKPTFRERVSDLIELSVTLLLTEASTSDLTY